MAFSSIIRRTASFVAPPLAITRRYYHPHLFLAGNSNSGFREAMCRSAAAHFSSAAERPESNVAFLRDLESSIKCAEESYDHNRVEEIPGGFPFVLQDDPGTRYITLGREYDDESIEVKVRFRLSDHVTRDDDNDDDHDVGHEEKGAQPRIPLVVNVFKGNVEGWLEFRCTAYPDEISIDGLAIGDPDTDKKEREARDSANEWVPVVDVAYKGPDFSGMDENLNKAFHKYLEIRGLKPSTANFLHKYMIGKKSHEYLRWLRNVKDFMEK